MKKALSKVAAIAALAAFGLVAGPAASAATLESGYQTVASTKVQTTGEAVTFAGQDEVLVLGETASEDSIQPSNFDNQILLSIWVGGGLLLLAGGAVTVAVTVRRNRKAAQES